MDKVELITPTVEMEEAAMDYVMEHRQYNEPDLHGGALLEQTTSYEEWVKQVQDYSNGENLNPGWVASSTFFGVRKEDGKIVGMIDIRHYLNDFLREYGGHIGFGVRPTERRKGYASAMLELALEYCKTLGLDKVMLACYKDNEASRNTILKYGGVLEREFPYSDVTGNTLSKEIVQVYWITLK